MLAQRWIGVIAPALSQPRGSPLAASWPEWTWAASSDGGDVLTSVDRPNPASFVGLTPGGGWRFEGSSGQPENTDRLLGAAFAPADPTIPKRPASGAGMPPKLSHGDDFCRSLSDFCAWSALTGVGLLAPSIRTRPERSRPPVLPLKSQVA